MFNKDEENVYTPQREDVNEGRKKVAMIIVGIILVIGLVAWIMRPSGLPGGTPVVRVDKSGQTPGISMHTPKEEIAIRDAILGAEGPISDNRADDYGMGVTETIESAVNYAFYNLVRDDNPNIDGVNTVAVIERMGSEKDTRWNGVFYDEFNAFEYTQLLNVTASKTYSPDELSEFKANLQAVANPREAYVKYGNGIVIEDITPDESPFYVMNVAVEYRSETSLPVRVEVNMMLSKSAVIFDIEPVGIAVIGESEAE